MRILIWSSLFLPDIGGIEVWTAHLLLELQRRGYELMVIAAMGKTPAPAVTSFHGIPVYRFPFVGKLFAQDIKAMRSLIEAVSELRRSFRPDVVHVNTILTGGFFHLRSRLAWPAPELFTVHYLTPMGLDGNGLFAQCVRSATWVSAVSRYMLDCSLAIVPDAAEWSSVIYNGLPMPDLEPSPLSFDPPTTVILGRVEDHKGFDTGLRAFARVRRRHPRARLIIAGDGDAIPRLQRLARGLRG